MQRYIKNRSGQLLGWTTEDKSTERAYDRRGKLLGWFNKKTDHTHDSKGRLLTISGNVTSGLIFDDDGSGDQ